MKNIFTLCLFFLILGFFIPYPVAALVQAPDDVRVYVDNNIIAADAEEATKVISTSDIDIHIYRPDSSDTIEKYVYEWNNSDKDAGLNENSPNAIQSESDPVEIDTINGSFFSDKDSDWNDAWYFHVKAIGINGGKSNESVFGPYFLDTLAPVKSTIKLKDIPGQQYPDSNQAVSATVIFEINSTPDLNWVYLSNTQNKAQAVKEYIDPSNVEYPYALSEFVTDPSDGKATVYAWFEDEAGNIWNISIDLTITGGKTMDPIVNSLEVGATQAFEIQGRDDTETFDWEILDADTGLASTAAEFVGASTDDVVTVTLKGVTEENNVIITAVSNADAKQYQSGKISIVSTAPAFNYDIDGNGKYDALTDGVLIIRYLFGFTGTTLTNKALSGDATRTDPDEIGTYIELGKTTGALEIDGNGKYDALTDGVLIIRYLFGFTGTTLTNKALAGDATRSDATAVAVFMDQYQPDI